MGYRESVRREAAALKAELQELTNTAPALSVVFELHDMTGVVGYTDVEGQPIDAPKDGDVVLTMRADLVPALTSTKDVAVVAGGRDSAKSGTAGRYVVAKMATGRTRALAVRDSRESTMTSTRQLILDVIESDPQLSAFFPLEDRTQNEIRAVNGSTIRFLGLREYRSVAIRSFEGIDLLWAEESQSLDRATIDAMEPTVRVPGSRIIYCLNPDRATDPVYVDYIKHDRPDAEVVTGVNYDGNPWCSAKTRRRAELLRQRDPGQYAHVYLGELRQHTESRVYDRIRVEPFDIGEIIADRIRLEVKDDHSLDVSARRAQRAGQIQAIENSFFIGLDYGASEGHDTALLECYLSDGPARTIYVTAERVRKAGPDDLVTLAKSLPRAAAGWPIRCDDARPDLTSHLNRHGLNATPAGKGIRSDDAKTRGVNPVQADIDLLRTFEIVVHPECPITARQLVGYQWQRDKNGLIIEGKPEKMDDDTCDALRYAVTKAARGGDIGYAYFDDEVW